MDTKSLKIVGFFESCGFFTGFNSHCHNFHSQVYIFKTDYFTSCKFMIDIINYVIAFCWIVFL